MVQPDHESAVTVSINYITQKIEISVGVVAAKQFQLRN